MARAAGSCGFFGVVMLGPVLLSAAFAGLGYELLHSERSPAGRSVPAAESAQSSPPVRGP